ncbi:MAG TPA: gamma-glutamyl-gamma-aminobutyrate hydrolase family protein [Firmicutes bacterium]|nr:gamma-glutamyl-gamma-aminobutyrate hydrolase family protein [Bacillota bacterium]
MHNGQRFPIIGISCSFKRRESRDPRPDRFYVNADYVRSVAAAGGIPVVLPHMLPPCGASPDAMELAIHNYLSSFDGLLLSGGGDVDPALYGEQPHPELDGVDRERDAFEIALARAARGMEIPVLAICRGIQVLNVSAGGTLIQDISDQVPCSIMHDAGDRISRSDVSHPVRVVPDSILGRIIEVQGCEPEIWVNSLHHQAIKEVAGGFRVVALSSKDGIIEAIEALDHPFCVGVQWHPEAMTVRDETSRKLFAEFIRAAKSFRLFKRGS